jgi:ribosomal protein L12E/L44/L45/RPP1/RPP2
MGAIPWVIMQIILVFVVIFVPQSVTMFLDEKVVVDIDKVTIEMPVEEPSSTDLKALELPASSGAAPSAASTSSENADKAAAEEQKKIDDLFKK